MYNKVANAEYIEYKNVKKKLDKVFDKYMTFSKTLRCFTQHKKRDNKSEKNYQKWKYDSTNILTGDTETTTVKVNRTKDDGKIVKVPFAYSYAQMLNLNGKVTIITRHMKDYGKVLDALHDWYKRKGLADVKNFTPVIWYHNLSYDFQFLLNIANISETLSRKKHDVIYAVDEKRHFMYRDSYSLLGVSLDKATADYDVEHKKLKGSLKYNLKRTPETELPEEEIAYCINDVQGLSEVIAILLKAQGYGAEKRGKKGYINFPYTKTGLVRNFISDYILENGLEDKCKNLFERIMIEPLIYKMLKLAYQGGYTHAFSSNKLKLIINVRSFDKASDYPYQMATKKYPMSKFTKSNKRYFMEDLQDNFEDYAYLLELTLKDVVCKNVLTIIPYEKFKKDIVNPAKDNGKLYSCDSITFTCTEMDFLSIIECYDIKGGIVFHSIYRAKKDYLPIWILEAVFEFYGKKTTLKDVDGQEVLYIYFKQLLNSIYGCCVQDPCKKSFSYVDGEWIVTSVEDDDQIKNAVNSKKRNVSYAWGVWVTAYARYELISVALRIDFRDLVYCDTDSLKFIDKPEYKDLFEELNEEMSADNERVANELAKTYSNISYDKYTPRNKYNEVKELGIWEDEGLYLLFKTTGAKRYGTYKYDSKKKQYKFEMTCCGIAKKNIRKHLIQQSGIELNPEKKEIDKVKKILSLFKQDFHVKSAYDENGESETGKMVHAYYDEECKNRVTAAKITDYQGIPCRVECKFYITLEPADFTLAENRDCISLKGIR